MHGNYPTMTTSDSALHQQCSYFRKAITNAYIILIIISLHHAETALKWQSKFTRSYQDHQDTHYVHVFQYIAGIGLILADTFTFIMNAPIAPSYTELSRDKLHYRSVANYKCNVVLATSSNTTLRTVELYKLPISN